MDNICAICHRRISAHSIEEVQKCSSEYSMLEIERTANELCISCGCPSDLCDPNGEFWCNGCLAWTTQLNDEGSDARLREDLQDEG